MNAVLFDRDGTLVHDVPYNADPARVRPVDGARAALDALRAHGIRTGVVTNQSGIARGLLTEADARRVNRRVDELLGPFDVWALCPHGPDDGCPCRKPRPGMVLWAAARIGADPADCVVIGDIGADVEAARRAGAHGILVPTPQTRPEETAAAPHVAPDLPSAVRLLLGTPPWDRVPDSPRPAAHGQDPPPGRGAPGDRPDTGPGPSAPAADRTGPSTGRGDRGAAATAPGGSGAGPARTRHPDVSGGTVPHAPEVRPTAGLARLPAHDVRTPQGRDA
ncbi:HAD-IIIA family hydrolase [Streptomyces griseoflavus]|uniref:HAD-IIIA family hydrolase n=1 Tax=Streptomyces griseoflavus TaxID=35619 RepID=UPI0038076204